MSNAWPRFWFEPWHWADHGWHLRYGVPVAPAAGSAARLVFGGWIGAFGLECEWRAPPDPRWLQLVSFSPALLRELASVLGWIAVLRASGGWRFARGGEGPLKRWPTHHPLWQCALRYRDVNCLESRIVESPTTTTYDARTAGLRLLQRAAAMQWPDISGRLLMMRSPDERHGEEPSTMACAGGGHSCSGDPPEPVVTGPLAIAHIDVGLCLAVALATARRLAATPAAAG
ncbi:hypothetical protein C9I57_29310 [Trinickia symbiotica]|uniref:Uncharacterized protein n=1 Tax=Trinickia symbiotica TaxID=863227 RepID=A0A2T3XKX5_9BURK|nr:hypothetical protein C9I57_29310 [Trinickia symbiotica]